MRILITGGAGFLGFWVAEQLRMIYPESAVGIIDRRLSTPISSVYFLQADLIAHSEATSAFANFKPTHVVHLASTVLRGDSNSTPESYLAHETTLHKTVGDLCMKHRIQKLIYTSSAAVYGEPDQVPTLETAPCRPISLYGKAKLAGEEYFHALAATTGVKVLILRLASLYGPGARSGVVYDLFERSQNGSPLKISGDGSQTRDFLYVADAAAIIARALATPMTGVYNVGSGVATPLVDLTHMIQGVTGVYSVIEYLPEDASSVRRNQLDTTKLGLAIPYQYTSLSTGLPLALGRCDR